MRERENICLYARKEKERNEWTVGDISADSLVPERESERERERERESERERERESEGIFHLDLGAYVRGNVVMPTEGTRRKWKLPRRSRS